MGTSGRHMVGVGDKNKTGERSGCDSTTLSKGATWRPTWAHTWLTRRETSGRAGKGVKGIFHPHELLAPGGGVGGYEAMKSRLQVLIGSLRLAVRLGMKTRGQAGEAPMRVKNAGQNEK